MATEDSNTNFAGSVSNSDSSPADFVFPEWSLLPQSLTIDDLQAAITYSGYPLQASVASRLQSLRDADGFSGAIQEEWAYVDADTGAVRSIDIFAELSFGSRSSIFSLLNLLVECKRSEMPYVFFLRSAPPSQVYDFPEIIGLRNSDVLVQGRQSFEVSIQDLLGVYDFSFCQTPCPFAITISKAARRGNKVELTGEDAYKSLTLPLMKAADHLKLLTRFKGEGDEDIKWFAPRVVICLAVVRAPMLGAYRIKVN